MAVLNAPGPDPNVCEACGSAMNHGIRGARTGLWVRVCTNLECQRATHSLDVPERPTPSQGPYVPLAPDEPLLPKMSGRFARLSATAGFRDWRAKQAGRDE